jgi:hypothetical protein
MALLVTTTGSLNRVLGPKKKRPTKSFGLLPLFESSYIKIAGALNSGATLSAGIVAVNEMDTAADTLTMETASATDNDMLAESDRSPVVPTLSVVVIRLALISFMATSWFLSRSYAITMYLLLGLAASAIALEQNDDNPIDHRHWIFSTVAFEVVLVALIYVLVRFRH